MKSEHNMTEKKVKVLTGIVIKMAMAQAVTVRVDSVKIHPIYKKRFVVSKKYKVHNESEEIAVGDKVEITSTRPLSKDIHYKLVKKI